MTREIFEELRRSSIWMVLFAASFVFMYLGVVLIIKYAFIYFEGFVPALSKALLRGAFYTVAALSVWYIFYLRRKRYSPRVLAPLKADAHALVKHLVNTIIFLIALSEVPLISGFILFFLGALYMDFYILSALTIALLYMSVPTVGFLEKSLSD